MNAARRNISPAARGSAPVDGALGKIDPTTLERAIARFPPEIVHAGRPIGGLDHPGDRSRHRLRPGRDRGDRGDRQAAQLPLHMDGARFANALVALDATPGRNDLEARRRHPLLRRHQERLLVRRGGRPVRSRPRRANSPSSASAPRSSSPSRASSRRSSRPISTDGLWLETARHANAMAARLAGGDRSFAAGAAGLAAAGQRSLRDHDQGRRPRRAAGGGRRTSTTGTCRTASTARSARTKSSAASSPASPRRSKKSTTLAT